MNGTQHTLEGKDLHEIGCQSLRCDLSIQDLMLLFEVLGVQYQIAHIETIIDYRNHLQRVTRSHALGY